MQSATINYNCLVNVGGAVVAALRILHSHSSIDGELGTTTTRARIITNIKCLGLDSPTQFAHDNGPRRKKSFHEENLKIRAKTQKFYFRPTEIDQ